MSRTLKAQHWRRLETLQAKCKFAPMTNRPACATINGFIVAPAGASLITGFLDHALAAVATRKWDNIY